MSAAPVIESTLQTLLAECAAADAECWSMVAVAEAAEKEYDRRKLSDSAEKYAELRNAAEQARLRADAAELDRDEKRRALGAHQAAEQQRTQREDRERARDAKQREFDAYRAQLLPHRAELETLMRVIPGEEFKLGVLMLELSRLRGGI